MIITIGAFDGFHKGHAELLNICRKYAVDNQWGVVTFYPHPSEFMHKLNHTLFTLKEIDLIRKILEIPNIFILNFDEKIKNLSPLNFWDLLRRKLNVDGLVMGSDFHFGAGRSGNAEYLEKIARSDGIDKIFVADLLNKNIYSSSNIRQKISEGNVENAAEILGYSWFMISSVVRGCERGRTMHFPTANLKLSENRIVPSDGVYSTAVLINHEWHCGALSIGNNPTFHDINEKRAEVHILNFSGDIYGNELPVFFLGRVRDIKTFSGKTELMQQIEFDVKTCEKIYENEKLKHKKFFEHVERIFYTQKNLKSEIINLI